MNCSSIGSYRTLRFYVIFLSLFLISLPLSAQSAEKLSTVRKLYLAPFDADRDAAPVRSKLVRRLEKSRQFRLVKSADQADAVLKGSARVWVIGQVSLDPHSKSAVESVLQGYLSIELIGRDHETLWSYLVTPSKFPWGGVPDDLARQAVIRLGSAVKQRSAYDISPEAASARANSALIGAGATFPSPLYKKWFESFEATHPGTRISYDAVGSSEGIRRLQQGELDFAASDVPLSDQQLSQFPARIRQWPTALGAVVPIYNLKTVHQTLNFTSETLADIYLGKIRKWNDRNILKSNPGVALPDAEIVVVHRSDGSGTTFVWSDFLSKISTEWKNTVGSGVSVRWPTGRGAEHNEGVASAVLQTPNSIGYVELIYAIQNQLSFGAVENTSGQFIKADISAVTSAALSSPPDGDFRVSLTNAPGKSAYPIASYTWFLVPDHASDAAKNESLAELLRWMLTSGQRSCSALGYVPLPADVSRRALKSIEPPR